MTTTTLSQQATALALANRRRMAAAHFKKEIRALPKSVGTRRVADLLERSADGDLVAMRVGQVLLAIERIGDRKVDALLAKAGIVNADRRVGELTARQRKALANLLRDRPAETPRLVRPVAAGPGPSPRPRPIVVDPRARLGAANANHDRKLTRIEALDQIGLPAEKIAALICLDFGDELSAGQVTQALKTGLYPRRAARSAA